MVERKVTSKDIETIYAEEEEKIHTWEKDRIKELVESPSLSSALMKINDLRLSSKQGDSNRSKIQPKRKLH